MTTQAVVDKDLGAVLQRGHVVGSVGRLFNRHAKTACSQCAGRKPQSQCKAQKDFFHLLDSPLVLVCLSEA
ncbi:hypothetical protein D9M69_624480 [compost metagenome]